VGGPDADPNAPDAGRAPPSPLEPEGGSIIFEHMQFSDSLASSDSDLPGEAVRVMAHFVSDQTPQVQQAPTPGECTNMVLSDRWPTSVGANPTYVNVGDIMISSGGSDPITMSPQDPGDSPDLLTREHEGAWYQHFPGSPGEIAPNTMHDVMFTGGEDYPETTFAGALEMPADFEVMNPGLNDDLVVDPNENLTVEWEAVESDGINAEVNSLIILVEPGETGETVFHTFCVKPNTGSATISSDALKSFQASNPDGGILLRAAFTHHLEWFDDGEIDDRRIDFLSLWCYAQEFSFAN
jgi:hypothetical protein